MPRVACTCARAAGAPRRARVATVPVPLPGLAVGRAAARVGLTALLAAGAAWLWRAPLVARIVGVRVRARVRLGALDLHPLRRACTLRKITMHDKDGRPLFAANEVELAYPARDPRRPDGKRPLFVTLKQPEVVAVFDNALCTRSNWTAWAARFSRQRGGTGSSEPAASGNTASSSEDNSRGGVYVQLDVVGGLLLSLRSQVLNGARIMQDVKLTEIDGVGNDLLSPDGTVALVERLSAKTIRAASRYSIPSEVRSGARAHARAVLREQTRGARALGRLQIKTLRKNIGIMDEYILKDMPDLRRYSEAAKTSQQFLLRLENVLKMVDPRDSDDEDADADSETEPSPNSGESRSQSGAASSSAEPPRAGPHPTATPGVRANPAADRASGSVRYFELDEEWRKTVGSSGSARESDRGS